MSCGSIRAVRARTRVSGPMKAGGVRGTVDAIGVARYSVNIRGAVQRHRECQQVFAVGATPSAPGMDGDRRFAARYQDAGSVLPRQFGMGCTDIPRLSLKIGAEIDHIEIHRTCSGRGSL